MADSLNSKLCAEDIHINGCNKRLQDKPQQASRNEGEQKTADQETTPEDRVLGKEEVGSVSEGVAGTPSGSTEKPINQGISSFADEEPRTNTEAVRTADMQSSSHLANDAPQSNEQSAQSSDGGNGGDRESIDRT